MNFTIDKQKLVEACQNLDVYVHGRKVATLSRLDCVYTLQYIPEAKQCDFISITMPTRKDPWRSSILHPFFQMNLPEGAMLQGVIKKFGWTVASDKMVHLGLAGTSLIGSVKVVPSGFPLDWRITPDINVEQLMHTPDSRSYFDELLDTCLGQGISGVMPKVIDPERSRCTVLGNRWIYKHDQDSGGEANYVGVCMNEYLCLRAASRAGLQVTDCAISEDGHTIALKRFDRAGERFEDFCSLSGISGENNQKYEGSMERLAKIIDKISSLRETDKETILRAHVLNMIIGNGDAHLKNFGILYTGLDDIKLSPTFDVVCTRAFNYTDSPALYLGGEKQWSLSDDFVQFAKNDCGITPARAYKIVEEVINGVNATMSDIAKAGNKHEWFREHAKMMILLWNDGIAMALDEPPPDEEEVLSKYKMSSPMMPEGEVFGGGGKDGEYMSMFI